MMTADRRPDACSQDSGAPFMAEEGAIKKQLRHWRDTGCKDGFGHGLWKQFAELGLTGICIPESAGRRRAWARSRRAWCWRRSAAT